MREILISAALVLSLAVLGFAALDHLGVPGDMAAAAAESGTGANGRLQAPPDGDVIEQPLHLVYSPTDRLAVTYGADRWYRLDYESLVTLENQRVPGCRLQLESSGEPLHVDGQWVQHDLVLGAHRMGVGELTPDTSPFPRQIVYMTTDQGAYLVFSLLVGTEVNTEQMFGTCRTDAETVLATLHRLQ